MKTLIGPVGDFIKFLGRGTYRYEEFRITYENETDDTIPLDSLVVLSRNFPTILSVRRSAFVNRLGLEETDWVVEVK